MYNPEQYWKLEKGNEQAWKNDADTNQSIVKSIERVKTLIIPEMKKRLTTVEGVLDAGCGSGYAINAFKESGLWNKCYGVDFQQHRIDYSKAKYPEGIEFSCGNLNTLPITDKSLSTIYTGAVLMHIPIENKIKVIQEFKRVLSDNGFYFGHEIVEDIHEINDTGAHVINTNLNWLQKQFAPFKVEVLKYHYDTYDFQIIYAHK